MAISKPIHVARIDQSPDHVLRWHVRDAVAELKRLADQHDTVSASTPFIVDLLKLQQKLALSLSATQLVRYRFVIALPGRNDVIGPLRVHSHPGRLLELAGALDLDELHKLRRPFSETSVVTVAMLSSENKAILAWRVHYEGIEDLPIECDAQCDGPALERFMLHGCRYEAMAEPDNFVHP